MNLRFDTVRGHSSLKETLLRATSGKKVAHAYLFAGPEGTGKSLLAEAFASAQFCLNPVGGEACGACVACGKVGRDSHPDFIRLAPEGKFIKVDAVRAMMKRVPFPPLDGHVRVVLIEDAHTLNETASNALLKTLEEPSSDTIFLLVTGFPERLLDTILSRCQILRTGRLAEEDILALLEELELGDAPSNASSVRLADGSISEAIRLIGTENSERRTALLESMSRLHEMGASETLRLAEQFAADKAVVAENFSLVRYWVRDWMLLLAGGDGASIVNVDWREALRDQAGSLTVRDITEALRQVDRIQGNLRFNVNGKLTAEHLMLTLQGLWREG